MPPEGVSLPWGKFSGLGGRVDVGVSKGLSLSGFGEGERDIVGW